MGVSQFHVHSIGYVAENKKLDSNEVQVLLIEELGFIDGEIKSNPTDIETEGVDGKGRSYQVKVTADNTITATWLPMGNGNRATPPDVRRGEKLTIWRVGETDKYYWTCNGDDAHLRKLETVIYTFSGTTDESKDGNDPKNAYYFEVSTHKGLITIHTCRENGEPFEYTIQLNTKEGVFVITDDIGNYIQLDSAESCIKLSNDIGTWVELNKEDINFNAVGNMLGKIGSDLNVDVGGDVAVSAGGDVAIKAGSNATMEAGADIGMDAGGTATVSGGAGAFLKCGGVSFGVTPGGFDAVG